ncbi:MAG TPA: NAD(P)H-dependent oxidoreductase [Dehalococcoidia bacterium]|nr:NAD(P)H-dependent oxidoreductase [Dehalococcoidia bacterium]
MAKPAANPILRAVAISGSPRTPSRSKALAGILLTELERAGCATSMIDVATLPADALLARASAPEIDGAIAAIGAAQIIIAASPTYRALYTGALKCFFDLMPQKHLFGKVCVPVLTAATPAHFLAIDHGFTPLFASLEGVALPGIFATDEQFVESVPARTLDERVGYVARLALDTARGIGS